MKKIIFLTILFCMYTAQAASLNYLYYCYDGGQGYYLLLGPDNKLQVEHIQTQNNYPGSYKYKKDALALSVPGIGFKENAAKMTYKKGFLMTFKTPSLACHLIGHNKGKAVEAYAQCPAIRHIPSISYEKNAFEFYPNHMVKRRRWKELVSIPDTLYYESFGFYFINGNKVFMGFGNSKEEKVLTGTIHGNSAITVDQLEPRRGRCTVQ